MRVFSVGEVATQLRVSENTVYRMIARGDIRKLALGPKLIRIPETELDRLLRAVNNGG